MAVFSTVKKTSTKKTVTGTIDDNNYYLQYINRLLVIKISHWILFCKISWVWVLYKLSRNLVPLSTEIWITSIPLSPCNKYILQTSNQIIYYLPLTSSCSFYWWVVQRVKYEYVISNKTVQIIVTVSFICLSNSTHNVLIVSDEVTNKWDNIELESAVELKWKSSTMKCYTDK